MEKQYTYKRAFLGFSESGIRGYSRPKFKTVRVKKKVRALDRIDQVTNISSLVPAQLIIVGISILTALALISNYIYSMMNSH